MQEEEISEGDEAVDSQDIPGWEKVDRLARALLRPRGLCVTNLPPGSRNSAALLRAVGL